VIEMPHIMELFGKTRVVIKDGKVVEAGEPVADWCPVFSKFSNVSRLTSQEAKKNMEYRIRELGMFTPERRFDYGVFVNFGASEIMMTALSRGLIDSTVTVCDGAGTVITDNPAAGKLRLIEKEKNINIILIGAHLTGIQNRDAQELIAKMDIITSCASNMVRHLVRPVLQAGTSVPMFALTQKGKELIIERAKEIDSPILTSIAQLPVLPEHKQPKPLI